jgi:hypothetical protein
MFSTCLTLSILLPSTTTFLSFRIPFAFY